MKDELRGKSTSELPFCYFPVGFNSFLNVVKSIGFTVTYWSLIKNQWKQNPFWSAFLQLVPKRFFYSCHKPPARKPLCLLSHLWTLTKLYEPTDYKRQLTVLNKHICFVSVCRLLVTEFLEQMKKTNRREDVPRGYLLEDLDNQEKSIHYEKSWVLPTAYKTPTPLTPWCDSYVNSP